MKQEIMKISYQEMIAYNIYELVLEGELVNYMKSAGQFLNIKISKDDLLLRRPLSLAYINNIEKICKVVYRIQGEGTYNLSKLRKNDFLNVIGPLGNGFDISFIKNNDTVLLIGGGIGIAPLYELARQLKNKGSKIINLFGFENKSDIFYEEEFKNLGQTDYSTIDGSYGKKGNVEDLLKNILKNISPDVVYSCGPKGLLKMVEKYFCNHLNAYLSLEARMGCGIGACYACVCTSKNNYDSYKVRKICSDGPVFKVGDVDL